MYHELKTYKRKYTVEELKRFLDGKTYKEYRDFKRRALVPAIDEINQYSDKTVSFEEVTLGRKVVAIELTIASKDTLETLKRKDEIEKDFDFDRITL